jgi:GNAT superfamily N-acetyltransferase
MMTRPVNIRTHLKPGDVGYLTYLHGKLYAEESNYDYTFDAYVAIPLSEFSLRSNPREQIWLAEQEEEIKGAIAIVERDAETAQLRWFLLHPSLRGHGLGKRLLDLAVGFCRQQGYQRILLGTAMDLNVAKSMYEAVGFYKIAEEEKFIWGRKETLEDYQLDL